MPLNFEQEYEAPQMVAKKSSYRLFTYIHQRLKYMDIGILLTTMMLISFGLIMVFSATMYLVEGGMSQPNPLNFLIKQSLAAVIGYTIAFFVMCLPYQLLSHVKWLNLYNIGVLFLLVMTYLVGIVGGGAKSWISLGPLSLQPSEFSKVTLVVLFANYLVYTEREFLIFKEAMKRPQIRMSQILALLILLMIFIQPDLGMVLILLFSAAYILVTYRFRTRGFLCLCAIFIAVIGISHLLSHYLGDWLVQTQFYQFGRIGSFSNPFRYEQGAGYQLINGFIAFSRGGWFGQGIGNSLTKVNSLPAGHTDFILAVIGEEFGFVGIVIFLAVFYSLIIQIFYWAARAKDMYRKCVLLGIGCLFLMQSIFNIGGIAGLLPLTGVTLPFISYGGSSMMVSILAIGLAQAMIIEEKRILYEDSQKNQLEIEEIVDDRI